MKENKRNKKMLSFKLLGLDVVSKEWGCRRNKVMFWNLSFFLIFHDKQKLGIWGNRALKVRRTKTIAQEFKAAN